MEKEINENLTPAQDARKNSGFVETTYNIGNVSCLIPTACIFSFPCSAFLLVFTYSYFSVLPCYEIP